MRSLNSLKSKFNTNKKYKINYTINARPLSKQYQIQVWMNGKCEHDKFQLEKNEKMTIVHPTHNH